MALDDDAVLIPGTGAVWTGTVGTAVEPTITQLNTYVSAGTVPSGHDSIGHTSLDDLPAPGQDEGETETKGSWQAPQLKTVLATQPVDYTDIKSLQILDPAVLSFYHGGGTVGAAGSGRFVGPNSPSPTEKAVTFLFVYSTIVLGLYWPKASIYRGDAMEFENAEFSTVPLRITRLKASGQPPFVWIGTGIV